VIKSEETLAIEFERRMRDLAKSTKAEALLIQMNPRVSSEFTRDDARALHAIEHETGKLFVFEGSEGLHLDHFAVVLEGTRDEVLERAVPFRVGEEVHVQIVEPHMYSPGDAVAKVDGYMISVVGGGPYVGEKHLVRIDEAGRTTAAASLLDAEPGPVGEAAIPKTSGGGSSRSRNSRSRRSGSSGGSRASGGSKAASESSSSSAPDSSSADGKPDTGEQKADEDGLQSKPRRRGRRGGRRRSGAKAESVPSSTE
jgi:ribonuclease G